MAKKLIDPGNKQAKEKKLRQAYDTTAVSTQDIGQTVEEMRLLAYAGRRVFERRWYDNNFFDDGFHFRYLSRTTNKIVDLSERATIYTPQRAIPKTSRQIRGIANLLLSQDPTPTVYPEEVDRSKFPQQAPQQQPLTQQPQQPGMGGGMPDQMGQQPTGLPQQGQPQPMQQPTQAPQAPSPYEQAKVAAGDIARKRGYWLEEEWRTPDASGETILEKLALMPVLSAKHGISYMQIWCDEHTEEIRTQVYDAFDIYVMGNYTSIYDCPFIIKSFPQTIAQIKSNPMFDPNQLDKINPDNRYASSEIKEAYMQVRYGRAVHSEHEATLLLKEAFIKEPINERNIEEIRASTNGKDILKDRGEGDTVIRHVFVAGNVWLFDEYLTMKEYPFVEFRFEPGPLYGVPLIERFINANKSLDSAVSRIERYFHTMVTGAWLKRKGEQFKITNISGGQVLEYDTTPPTQAQPSSVPPFAFEFINLLESFIEEQGVSTSTLGKLPAGVKANSAIESLKQSEYANLIIATRRMKETVRKIAVKMFELADENYVHSKSISHNVRGKTQFFDVIGASALSKRRKLKIDTQDDLVPLSSGVKVDIEVESGMAYTKEGQKATMQQLIETLLQYVQVGAIPVAPVKIAIEKYLETYGFGATAEFMDEFEKGLQGNNMSDDELTKMKMALLQALQDAGEVGPEGDQAKVEAASLGALKALKDAGLVKHIQAAGEAATAKDNPELAPIPYKDAPEDIKRQMEANAGLQPSQTISPMGSDQILKHKQLEHTQQTSQQELTLKEKQMNQPKGVNETSSNS